MTERASFGRLRADLAEGRLHLVDHEIDDVAGTFGAERAQAPQEGLAGEGHVGAERDRARHVQPGADAGIEHHRSAAADGAGDRRQHVDRRRQALDLAAAVVRHHDAVDAERHAFLGVGRMENSLHHQRTLPALAIARDLVPGEGAAHFATRERRDFVHVGVVLGIGLEIAEARLAVLQQRPADSRARSQCRRACAGRAGTAR